MLQLVSEPDTKRCASEDAGPRRGVDCDPTSVGKGNEAFFIKGVETSPQNTHFKNLEVKPERENRKRTISASGGIGLLQFSRGKMDSDMTTFSFTLRRQLVRVIRERASS